MEGYPLSLQEIPNFISMETAFPWKKNASPEIHILREPADDFQLFFFRRFLAKLTRTISTKTPAPPAVIRKAYFSPGS